MVEKNNKPKIGLTDNWLGANKPNYFTKYTLLAIPFLLWKVVKLALWLLFAFFIIQLIQWSFDSPFPPVTDFWSGAGYLVLAWVIKDLCQGLWTRYRKRKKPFGR